jgi:hypothetical protein
VFKCSRKPKVGRFDEHLLVEALAAISTLLAPSMPLIGVVAKPMSALARDGVVSMPGPFRDEVNQPLLQRGFLIPIDAVLPLSKVRGFPLTSVQFVFECPALLSFSNVGESSRGGIF